MFRMRQKDRPQFFKLANMTTDYVEWFRDSRPEGSTVLVDGKFVRVVRSYPSFCELSNGCSRTWAELAGQYWSESGKKV